MTTWEIILTILATIVGSTGVSGWFSVRATRKQLAALANKTDAETTKVHIDAQLAPATVIKDISEAAALLVVPLTSENEKLRREKKERDERIQDLEDRVEILERENRLKDRTIHDERDKIARMTNMTESRIKELLSELVEMRNRVKILEETSTAGGSANGKETTEPGQ